MFSRRRLLWWGALGLGTIGLSSLLVACGDDDTDAGVGDPSDDDEETPDTDDETDDEDDDEPDDDAARRGGTLEYGVATNYIDVLDPNITAQTVAHLVVLPMFDSIVYQDNDGGFHPGLAEDWEISDDGETYTFTFQSGVRSRSRPRVDRRRNPRSLAVRSNGRADRATG